MLGYFSVYRSNDEKYAGGILVLNEKGLPVTFKYTTPIKPNKIQRIIYGKNLKSYIASEIIGKKLMEIAKDIDVIFVPDNETLDFLTTDKPVAYISESFVSEPYFKGREAMLSAGASYSIKMIFNKEINEQLYKKFSDLSDIFDIIEPFVRLNEALEFVCSEEK